MNRDEYIRRLEYRLRKLPKEEYDKAISYFMEYFDEAGAENETQAIQDLGTPEMAADQIIREFAVKNAKEPAKDVRHGISAVWIGILAVFAAPIALPFALMLGLLGLMLVLCFFMLVLSACILVVSIVAASIPCIIVGFYMLFHSFANGITTLGFGLVGLGIGILLILGCIRLGKCVLHLATRLFARVAGEKICHHRKTPVDDIIDTDKQ